MTENLRWKGLFIFALTGLAVVLSLLSLPVKDRPGFLQTVDEEGKYTIHLGLDLSGGAEIRLQVPADEAKARRVTVEQAVSDSLGVIEKRIAESGIVKDSSIRRQGSDIILIQLPGVTQRELDEIKRIITELGSLEFRIVAKDEGTLNIGREREKRRQLGSRYEPPKGYMWVPVDDRAASDPPFNGNDEALVILDNYNWTGDKLAAVGVDLHPRTLQRIATFDIITTQKANFGEFTQKYIDWPMAIIYNGKIVSAPNIRSRINGAGIIEGLSEDEVTSLKKILKSGSLKVRPRLISTNVVGPSLGQYTIDNGKRAIILGFLFVIVFMLVYYLTAGLVANVALVLNLVYLYAALVGFGATLTLPGIAGVILTVGMAVDANIIIFERIREERAAGKSLLQAVENGYERALTAIVDANITTLITAIILYYFGSGAVKGFAVTLLLGIIISMFTALYVTRVIFGGLIRANIISDLKMVNLVGTPKLNLLGLRRMMMVVSLVVIVAGMGLFFKADDSLYGIDLAGGSLTEMALNERVPADTVRTTIPAAFAAEVQEVRMHGEVATRQTKSKYSVSARNLELMYFVRNRQAVWDELAKHLKAERGEAWLKERKDQALRDVKSEQLGTQFGELMRFLVFVERAEELDMFPDLTTYKGQAIPLKPAKEEEKASSSEAGRAAKRIRRYLADINQEQVSPEYFRFVLATRFKDKLVPDGIGIPTKLTGGQDGFKVQLSFDHQYTEDQIRTRIDAIGHYRDYSLKAVGNGDGGSSFSYDLTVFVSKPDLRAVPSQVSDIQNEDVLFCERFPTSESIGELVAKHQKQDALTAVLLSLIAILIYITIRFEFINGVAAIICLAHDVMITLGAIALFGGALGDKLLAVEINLPILAAFLTIIGYSLNDTIVVFDRIRENMNKPGRHKFEPTANVSINQTLSRTLMTSFTTMLAVITLFVLNFGKGGVIEGFAFALIVGVLIGTYSSVFVATPILVEWYNMQKVKEAEQKVARQQKKEERKDERKGKGKKGKKGKK